MKILCFFLLITISFVLSSDLSSRGETASFSLLQDEQKIFRWEGCVGANSNAVIQIHLQGGSNLQTFVAAGRIPLGTPEFLVRDGQMLSSQTNSDSVVWYFLVKAVGGSVPSGSLSVDSVGTSALNSGTPVTLSLGSGSMVLFRLGAKPNSGSVIQIIAPTNVKVYASSKSIPSPTSSYQVDSNGYATTTADGSAWWVLLQATGAVNGQLTVNSIDTVTIQSGVAATAVIPAYGKRVYKFAPSSGTGLVYVSFTEGLKLTGVAGGDELCYLANEAYHPSQGNDNQPWFFVLSGGDSTISASFTVRTTTIQTLSSGVTASFSLSQQEQRVFKLPAAASYGAAVKVDYTGNTYVYASNGIIVKSQIIVPGGYQLGTNDNSDWYFVVVGKAATASTLTVTAIPTTSITSGSTLPYSLEINEIKVFKLAKSQGSTGLIKATNSGTGNFKLYVSKNGISRDAHSTVAAQKSTWFAAEDQPSDESDWWFISQSQGEAINGASLQVTSVATNSFESGTTQSVDLLNGEYQIFKMNSQVDKGATISIQFSNQDNVDAYISGGSIPKLTPLASYMGDLALLSSTTDNVPWYFIFKANQAASFTFQATLLDTQIIQSGGSANVDVDVGQYKVLRVEGLDSSSFAQVVFSAGQGGIQPRVTIGNSKVDNCNEQSIGSEFYIPEVNLMPKEWFITVSTATGALVGSTVTVPKHNIDLISGTCNMPSVSVVINSQSQSPSQSSSIQSSSNSGTLNTTPVTLSVSSNPQTELTSTVNSSLDENPSTENSQDTNDEDAINQMSASVRILLNSWTLILVSATFVLY